MSRCTGYNVLLLATLLAGVTSVTCISKYVCIGDHVPLFQNLTFGSERTTVFLYKTHPKTPQLVASWSNPKSDKDPPLIEHYEKRLVFDDQGGNVFLEQFRKSDEATYEIQYGVNMTQEVEIVALVPPDVNCKPEIQRMGSNLLSASVEINICGKPPASIKWIDSPGISNITDTVIKLPPGKEAGTYSACMDGMALRCVKNATEVDFCSNYTIDSEKHSPPVPSESLDQTHWWYALPAIISIIIVAGIIIIILCCKMKKLKARALKSEARCHRLQQRLQGSKNRAPDNIPFIDQQLQGSENQAPENNPFIDQQLQGRTTDTSEGNEFEMALLS